MFIISMSKTFTIAMLVLLASLMPTPSFCFDFQESCSINYTKLDLDGRIIGNNASFKGDFNPALCTVSSKDSSDPEEGTWVLSLSCGWDKDIKMELYYINDLVDTLTIEEGTTLGLDLTVENGGDAEGPIGSLVLEPTQGNYVELLKVGEFVGALDRSSTSSLKKLSLTTDGGVQAPVKFQYPLSNGDRRRLILV